RLGNMTISINIISQIEIGEAVESVRGGGWRRCLRPRGRGRSPVIGKQRRQAEASDVCSDWFGRPSCRVASPWPAEAERSVLPFPSTRRSQPMPGATTSSVAPSTATGAGEAAEAAAEAIAGSANQEVAFSLQLSQEQRDIRDWVRGFAAHV